MGSKTGGNLGIAAIILFGVFPSHAGSQSRRLLQHESERQALFQSETTVFQRAWEGQALLGVENNRSDAPIIFRIDREGRTERTQFAFAGARYIFIIGLAGGSDGAIVAIGSAYSDDARAGAFLARISPNRDGHVVVQLQPYLAKAVMIAPGGIIWTVGWVWDGETVAQNNVIERFDSSGKLVGAAVPVAAHGRWSSRNPDATENSILRCSKDRVGWLTNANQYIEFDLNGRELGRFPSPPGPAPQAFESTLALSEDNEVLVGTRDGKGMRVWMLNREKQTWEGVELAGARLTQWATLGFDGRTVVVVDGGTPWGATVARYTSSALK